MTGVRLSVIIPALDEGRALPLLLADLRELDGPAREVIVVDGGSGDDTVAVAAAAGARVLPAPRGRARQLNAGARAARGNWLLFLHADSRLDAEARQVLRTVLEGPPSFTVAVFRFAIDLPRGWKRFIEGGQRLREALFDLPYGDQGLLVRRDAFEAAGGYPDLPLMEDVALIRRLRQRQAIVRLPASLVTSGRRYREQGVIRTLLMHSALILLYHLGVPPARLAAWRHGSSPSIA
jgi:rSAM/selenodomain-associated transferase 2